MNPKAIIKPKIKRILIEDSPPIDMSKAITLAGTKIYETNVIASDPRDAGEILRKYGVVVVSCFSAEEIYDINTQFKEDTSNFPEYRDNSGNSSSVTVDTDKDLNYTLTVSEASNAPEEIYKGRVAKASQLTDLRDATRKYNNIRIKRVLGSFQALGNPSSFHCVSARRVRSQCYKHAHGLFKYVHEKEKGWNIEMNYDRMAFRQKGTKIATDKDSWHRDVINKKYINPTDIMFGGWINLDTVGNQSFICKTGTHQRPEGQSQFVKCNAPEYANSITIPPGHLVIFYQHILHAIAPHTFSKDSYRQFTSWRLTKSLIPFYMKDKVDNITNQTVPMTPGGQVISLCSQHHKSALLWKHTVVWAVSTLKREYIERHQSKNGKAVYYLPQFPLVPQYNKSMFPPYSEDEMAILRPTPV